MPIAYFVGLHDDLADPTDTAYTFKQIKTAFQYKVFDDMDHYSFATGADMAYTGDALALVAEHNIGNYPTSATSVETPDAAAAAEVESTLV